MAPDEADPPTIPLDPTRGGAPTDELEPETLGPARVAARGSIVADDPTTQSGVYELGEVIGRGGMGEVVRARDRKIGREVALKRMRGAAPGDDERARFLREARIQARLDHPAIVPVYELAKDPAGRPYFTMKRLTGQTLVQILGSHSATRQRLLRAFADICRAIDFAHSRGIVHRDLKPANIVLGEFGEAYILDWGVARVLGDVAEVITADIDTLEGSAPVGQVLGTPGYMAPEQLRHPDVTRAADVYGLGSLLFEILAGEPLHPRGQAAIESTLSEHTVLSPAIRRPDRVVPPELDGLCLAMLLHSSKHRPTARVCADRIEQYLDGDRDLVNRRALATDLVAKARAALDDDRRADAMREASRAMALDPHVDGAAELVTRLMLQPPREEPPELRAALARADSEDIARHAKSAVPGYIMIAAFVPLIAATGVRAWWIVVGIALAALGMAIAARRFAQTPQRTFGAWIAYAIGNAAIIVLLGRLASAFTFVPALAAFITASLITYPAFVEKPRSWILLLVMIGGLLGPLGLELLGILPQSFDLRDHGMFLRGDAMELGSTLSTFTVVLASLATVLMCGIQAATLGRANRAAQHKLVAQAWHLQQLLPAPVAKA